MAWEPKPLAVPPFLKTAGGLYVVGKTTRRLRVGTEPRTME
jgi:hypothetical protein